MKLLRKILLIILMIFLFWSFQFLYGEMKSIVNGSCEFITNCDGNNAVDCFEDWLKKSNCFPKEYIQTHFKNFRVLSDETPKIFVTFDFVINGYNLCSEGQPDCQVVIYRDDNDFTVHTVYSPLKKYEMNISKEKAIKIFRKNDDCVNFSEVNLKARDQFNKRRGDGFVGYEYDQYGLHWVTRTSDRGGMCGRLCIINAKSGKLYKGKYSCI